MHFFIALYKNLIDNLTGYKNTKVISANYFKKEFYILSLKLNKNVKLLYNCI